MQAPRLPASAERAALSARFDGQSLHFLVVPGALESATPPASGDGATEASQREGAEDFAQLSVAIPPAARDLALSWKVQELRNGEHALWARWGSVEEHYSVVALGPTTRASSAVAPAEGLESAQLVFRGWSRPSSSQLSWVERADALDLYVVGPERRQLCGREVATHLRRLNPVTGEFSAVRVPPLAASERQKASPLRLHPAPEGGVRLQLLSTSASAATDGSLEVGMDRPYSFFEVTRLVDSRKWILELAESSLDASESELYLATDQGLHRLEVPSEPVRRWSLTIPDDAECAALVQGSRPSRVLEVVAHLDVEPLECQELLPRLEEPEPGWAPRAIAEGGPSSMMALARAFSGLSPLGRRRALAVARSVSIGGPVLLAALETQHAVEALEELRMRRAAARPVLLQALSSAPMTVLEEIIELLVDLNAKDAVDDLLVVLQRVPPERGKMLVRALGRIEHPVARESLEQVVLRGPGRWSELPPPVATHFLREFGPRVPESEIRESLLHHSREADFERAYGLLPLLLRSARAEPALRDRLVHWLTEDSRWGEREHAALSVAILEALEFQESRLVDLEKAGLVSRLLLDDNVRVRAATARYLSKFPAATATQQLLDLGRRDAWPLVRGPALRALGALLDEPPSSDSGVQPEEVEQFLARRSRKDDDRGVRREAVAALGSGRGVPSLKSLRRSLQKDESASVRAEAALSLGRRCDGASVELLFGLLGALKREQTTREEVMIALAALTALLRIDPPTLDEKLQELLEAEGAGQLQSRIEGQLASERGRCAP